MVGTKRIRGEWIFQEISKNHLIVYPNPAKHTNSSVLMTGADVVLEINIPYAHRIHKLVFIHLDTNYAKSIDALDIDFEMQQGKSDISAYFTDMLFQEDNIIVAEITEVFGESYEYEPRTWSLTLNTTNTDRVIPVLYIEKLGAEKN